MMYSLPSLSQAEKLFRLLPRCRRGRERKAAPNSLLTAQGTYGILVKKATSVQLSAKEWGKIKAGFLLIADR
jgi:hypothetical protein